MAHDTKLHNSDDSAVFASRHGRRSRTFKSDWFQHDPCTEEQAEWLMNRPGFPGECFICELRLPDHRFRWKHNKLFL
ncbi:hypothetical protein ACEA44_17795, partial [Escherichia coli]